MSIQSKEFINTELVLDSESESKSDTELRTRLEYGSDSK